jgi:hypothetical protein
MNSLLAYTVFLAEAKAMLVKDKELGKLDERTQYSPYLKVLTIIHNFDLKRQDGTTAVQRLFDKPFPDLFESVGVTYQAQDAH